MNNVTTSFVLPVYNGEELLGATIDSVLAQTDPDFELIAVDDGSTDETARILDRYAARDERIRVIRQANAGITRALIAGCAAACGTFIARLDAGDLCHPRRLAAQKKLLETEGVVFVSCATQYVGPHLEPLWITYPTGAALDGSNILDPASPRFLSDGPTHHGSVMFRRDAYEKVGGYRPQFYYGQDFDLWYRLAAFGKFRTTNEILYTARVTAGSISNEARTEQARIAQLSRSAAEARLRGGSESAILEAAAAVLPKPGRKRRVAEGLYFIGEALRRNHDERARSYLWRSARAWPLSAATWLRLSQVLLSAVHRKAGLKYRADRARRYAGHFGILGAVHVRRQLFRRKGGIERVSVPGLSQPLLLRGGTADGSTFEHVFVWDDYDLPFPPDVHTIIDAGANIGLASVFFASRFPDARIIALEPEAGNFELLEQNVRPYPNVVPLQAALWSEETTLRLANPEARVDSYRFDTSDGDRTVPAFDVAAVLDRFDLPSADVLKIDIEGGETAVFRDAANWIGRVRMMIIELHDDAARTNFDAATAHLTGTRFQRGENTVFIVSEPGP